MPTRELRLEFTPPTPPLQGGERKGAEAGIPSRAPIGTVSTACVQQSRHQFFLAPVPSSLVVLFVFMAGTAALAQQPTPAPIRVPPPSDHVARSAASSEPGASPLHSSGWWLGSTGIALVLAVCGAICVAARKYRPQDSTAPVRVVGRVSLTPRHSIFMVQAGRRVLLIGTGSQGAPTLLGELSEDDQIDGEAGRARQHPAQGIRESRLVAAIGPRSAHGLDVRLGEEE
jgi:flagellar protein FliO/FliZ